MLNKIKNPDELYLYIRDNIKYGFKCIDGNIYCRYEMNDDKLYESLLFNKYYLQTPNELLKNKYGICYDQVELIRYWLNLNNYDNWTYYTPYHNHSIIIYKDDDKYCIMETSIKEYNGIHKFNSLEEAIKDYKKFQLKDTSISDIKLYLYDNVLFGCNFYDLIYHITKDKNLVNNLKIKHDV